jgi:hypothetical protein
MSEVIRRFRITNVPYRQAEPVMDGKESPFRLPVHQNPIKAPELRIEGLPPVIAPNRRKEDMT